MATRLLGIASIRVEILAVLRSQPSATISELARQVGASRNSVNAHLKVLAELGVVGFSVQRIPGSFRPAACFHLRADRAEEVAWLLFDLFAP